MEFDFSRLFFTLASLGFPVLAVAGLGCLFYCKGKCRRYLTWAAGVFLGALALMFGGEIALGCFRLTWRSLPMLVLCGTLLVSGWVGTAFTVACLMPMELPVLPAVPRRIVKGAVLFFAALVLLVTIWVGPFVLAFAFGNEERVVEYQGQTLVEVNDGFLDPHYSYYEYHGPLVRGAERVYDGPTHIWGDVDTDKQ